MAELLDGTGGGESVALPRMLRYERSQRWDSRLAIAAVRRRRRQFFCSKRFDDLLSCY